MTPLLVGVGVALGLWALWRTLQWLAAIGRRHRLAAAELWREPILPPLYLCGLRAKSAAGADLVTLGLYTITTEPGGERVTLLREVGTLDPDTAHVARGLMVQALTQRPPLGGLH